MLPVSRLVKVLMKSTKFSIPFPSFPDLSAPVRGVLQSPATTGTWHFIEILASNVFDVLCSNI